MARTVAAPDTVARVRPRDSDAEATLVARLQTGDEWAVADLAAAHGAQIFRLALRCLRNHEDAEELTQDVLLLVSRRIGAFRQDSALGSWIHRITLNAAMSRLRRLGRRRRFEVGGLWSTASHAEGAMVPDPADGAPPVDAVLVQRERLAQLREAMTMLSPAVRRCIVVRDLGGLTTSDASRALQVNVDTVKSRIHRGRLQLRRRLRQLDCTNPKLAYTVAHYLE
jgi:RNA polymerase sigma-70 factor (ECF subfamily)